jgi:hypothetical protein
MKVPDIQVGLVVNGSQQLLVYAADINLLGDNIGIIKKEQRMVLLSCGI